MTDVARSYALPTERIPSLHFSHHLDDIIQLRELLEDRGIETRNTRIERYQHYLEHSLADSSNPAGAEQIFKDSVGEPFRGPADWHLYVLREVHELMWIMKGLRVHIPIGADEKLRLIAGGRDFAALEMDSRSRDAQFELRIASYFCQGGCKVDVSTGTDVVALADRYAFFVECKRVGSKNKLGKRLSDARKQLARRVPRKVAGRITLGCIAIDVTKVAFTHNGLTLGLTSEHSRDVIQKKLFEIGANADRLLSFDSCRELSCCWLQIHIPALVMHPAEFTTRFSSYHIRRPSLRRKAARAFADFYEMFESVSRYDSRASSGQTVTPRNEVAFPVGTTFGLEDARVLQLLGQSTVSEDEQAEEIGSITMDDVEHKFTFFEVILLSREIIERWKREMAVDQARGHLLLLARLYAQRYLYVDSDEPPQPIARSE